MSGAEFHARIDLDKMKISDADKITFKPIKKPPRVHMYGAKKLVGMNLKARVFRRRCVMISR